MYRPASYNAWCFVMPESDTPAPTLVKACAGSLTQEGANVGAFFLQKRLDRWAFGRPPTDSSASVMLATSTATFTPSTWTHLVGVYDATNGQIRLYVNGVLNATVACSCSWASSGNFTIGRTKWPQPDPEWWPGKIDDVRVYQGVLSAPQIGYLASL